MFQLVNQQIAAFYGGLRLEKKINPLKSELNLHSREVNSCHSSVRKSGWMVEITKGQRRINEHNKRSETKEHSDTTMHYLLIHL